MKTLFSLRSLLPALLLLAAVSAPAQQYQPITLLAGGTQNISASGTSNYTAVANVRACDTAGILTSFKLTGAGTENITFKFSKSPDGSNFETTPSVTITVAANGATAVNTYTATSVTGVNTLKLVSVQNGSATVAVTNLTVIVGVKNFVR